VGVERRIKDILKHLNKNDNFMQENGWQQKRGKVAIVRVSLLPSFALSFSLSLYVECVWRG